MSVLHSFSFRHHIRPSLPILPSMSTPPPLVEPCPQTACIRVFYPRDVVVLVHDLFAIEDAGARPFRAYANEEDPDKDPDDDEFKEGADSAES